MSFENLDENAQAMELIKTFNADDKGARGKFIAAAVKMGMKATTAGAYWQRNKKYATFKPNTTVANVTDGRTWGLRRNAPPEKGKWKAQGGIRITSEIRQSMLSISPEASRHLLQLNGYIYPAIVEEGVGLFLSNSDGSEVSAIVKDKVGRWFIDGDKVVRQSYIGFASNLISHMDMYRDESNSPRIKKLIDKVYARVTKGDAVSDDPDDVVDPVDNTGDNVTKVADSTGDVKVDMNVLITSFNLNDKGARGKFIAAATKGGQKATTAGAFWQRNKSKANNSDVADVGVKVDPDPIIAPTDIAVPDGAYPSDIAVDRIIAEFPVLKNQFNEIDPSGRRRLSYSHRDGYMFVSLFIYFNRGEQGGDVVPGVKIDANKPVDMKVDEFVTRVRDIMNGAKIKADLLNMSDDVINDIDSSPEDWDADIKKVQGFLDTVKSMKVKSTDKSVRDSVRYAPSGVIQAVGRKYGIREYVNGVYTIAELEEAKAQKEANTLIIGDRTTTIKYIPSIQYADTPDLQEYLSDNGIQLAYDRLGQLYDRIYTGKLKSADEFLDFINATNPDDIFHYASDEKIREMYNDTLLNSVLKDDYDFYGEFGEMMTGFLDKSKLSEEDAYVQARHIHNNASHMAQRCIAKGMGEGSFKDEHGRLLRLINGKFGLTINDEITDRAYHTDHGTYSKVTLPSRGIDRTTYWHEVGHAFERHDIIVLRWAQEYLISRLRKQQYTTDPDGLQFQPLKRLTGVNYADREVAVDDHFFDKYIGKVYGRLKRDSVKDWPSDYQGAVQEIRLCRATEVISMGMQFFHAPGPAKELAKKDPELFDIIVRVLERYTNG